MNSTPGPKADKPRDASIEGADERLSRAHAEIVRADGQLARLSEQVARMERHAARASSGRPGLRGRRTLGTVVGLALAACIVVAALVLRLSFDGGAKPVVAPSPPQLAATPSLPPENTPVPAEPAPPAVQVAAVEAAPPPAAPVAPTAPPAASVAQTAPQDAAPTVTAPTVTVPTVTLPTAAAVPPDHTQLLQTMARDLANLQRNIEQLKATQQKIASDHAKDIAELKASQEEMKRVLAKVSEQNPSRASPPPAPPTRPAPALRKPERTVQSPRERPRPRYRRDWYYDDW